MATLKFLLALLAVAVLHFVGARISGDMPQMLDLFLVLVVLIALRGDLLVGLVVGLVTGLLTDAATGGLYGLHGFADTIIGYGTAFAAQRLVIRKPPGVFLIFALAAAAQQAILIGLAVFLLADLALPDLKWTLIKVGATGVAGVLVVMVRENLTRRLDVWRRSRTSRLK